MGIAFLAVSLTDLVDGYIARMHNQESRIGKLLDPLADKLLVMTAFVMLVGVGRIPPEALPLVVVILARELVVTGLRGMAGTQGVVIGASSLGKWKTGFQLAAITALLIHWPFLGLPVLRRAMRDGNAPRMAAWLADGSHELVEWETDLSSQTGASQAGILLGSNEDIPAVRWVEK